MATSTGEAPGAKLGKLESTAGATGLTTTALLPALFTITPILVSGFMAVAMLLVGDAPVTAGEVWSRMLKTKAGTLPPKSERRAFAVSSLMLTPRTLGGVARVATGSA